MTRTEDEPLTQAANWAETLDALHDEAKTLDFMNWREGAPGNGLMYLEQANLGEMLRKLSPPDYSIETLVAAAREGFEPGDFVTPAKLATRRPRVSLGEWLGLPVGVLLAASIAIVAAFLISYSTRWIEYTAVTESREIRLKDGSTALLFPHSRIRMRVLWKERQYVQEEGGSSLNVSHDSKEPLFVLTRKARAQALGTQLNIIRRDGLTDIFLQSGSIRLSNDDHKTVDMTPGQFTRLDDDGRIDPPRSQEDIRNEPGHEQDFEDAMLADIASAFNRVNSSVQFEVRGAAARQVFSATLNLADPGEWIEVLRHDPLLQVEVRPGLVKISPRR
jgi:ferric-dicitrate binding protein FerR (iron transport regulator)